ncbi:hypothetical protein EJ05DRAFT_501309 [Pseudovirgaria hyperparasitica]|uniref:Uncharacterized protein n=1 Tax=Pseudovirgaria hyperparasitica TaxID=470096 RepID=A0A6A6W4D6_9PEZI|nr:uncharacterized protein EJ05DRAFT_501309 [Pseudovirgaria hyperparasitica]KAF2757788.1 hypothetical protein EJ05DRAFT_501309 [Pseudovirgaria hyperparasitica]
MQFSAIFATVLAASVATVSAQSSEPVVTLTPCPPGATPTGGNGGVPTPPPFTGAANSLPFPTAAAVAVMGVAAYFA